ncbi:hypothetical protein [Tumebacillus permanentifrigoris]|nr:hypothetical protein [Tumebacillus permanentifrigoris]
MYRGGAQKPNLTHAHLLQLQSTIGNRALTRALARQMATPSPGVLQKQVAPIQMDKYDDQKTALNKKKEQIDKQLNDRSKLLLQGPLSEFTDELDMMNSEYWNNWNVEIKNQYLVAARQKFDVLPALLIRATRAQKRQEEFVSKTQQIDTLLGKCNTAVGHATLSPMQTSFATPEQVALFTSLRPIVVQAREKVRTQKQSLADAYQTFSAINTLPTEQELQDAWLVIREMPSEHYFARVFKLAREESSSLDAVTIKEKMQDLIQAAVDDPTKQLDLDDAGVRSLAESYYSKSYTKIQVDAQLVHAVHQQHTPQKSVWLKLLGLEKGSHNVWIKDSVGTIDGMNVHASRFKDTMPNQASLHTPAATLKNQILGQGDGGFHVTLERFGAHGGPNGERNPHSYRNGATRMNDFTPNPNGTGLTWMNVSAQLAAIRNTEVTDAETKIDDFVARLGREQP